ncbi:MAG: hypothetical protein NTV43_05575 [Methylococcales bacterium]|nr:hypothetical protein [Methylococcales bacterium]
MRNNSLLLITLLITTTPVMAEQSLLNSASKQLVKNAATSALPKEAVSAIDSASSAKQTLDTASKLTTGVKATSDSLKGTAQDVVTDTAKQKLLDAAPADIKSLESATKSTKLLTDKLPKSSTPISKTVKDQVQKEATKSALDLLK